MSDYTPEQVEQTAKWCSENSSGIYRPSAIAADMLRAYAATLRQQSEQACGMVSDEVVQKAWLAYNSGSPKSLAPERERFRHAIEAALAQNTQGEAEPVAWMRESGAPAGSETSVITKVIRDLWLQCNPLLVERYTIPLYLHAAHATVPDEITQQVFREDDPERFGYVRGFNACRNLVLAAAPPQPKDAQS